MDKPQSMSVRDYLVRTLAVKLMVPEKTIDAIVVHQVQEANLALQGNDTIEISGFGKFFFNQKKAQKKMNKLIDIKSAIEKQLANPEISEHKRKGFELKLNGLLLTIENLKPKIYEDLTDIRRLEECSDAS